MSTSFFMFATDYWVDNSWQTYEKKAVIAQKLLIITILWLSA